MAQVWVVTRYWLSRKTGKPDRVSFSRVAVFGSRGEALDYAIAREARIGNPRCRFAVQRFKGSLGSFVEECPSRVYARPPGGERRNWGLPVEGGP